MVSSNASLEVDDHSKLIDISVLDASNPERFWFVSKEELEVVENLIKAMNKHYYGGTGKNNLLPPDQVKLEDLSVDDLVAVEYDIDLWHRGKILEVKGSSLKIFYVDFGTVGKIEFGLKVRKLRKKFLSAPVHLKRGTLFGISTESWSPAATKCFSELVSGSKILARTCGYDQKSRVHQLDIYVKQEGKSQSINDILCEKDFCFYNFNLVSISKLEDFDDLEQGKCVMNELMIAVGIEEASKIITENIDHVRALDKKFQDHPIVAKKLETVPPKIAARPFLKASGKRRQILPQSLRSFEIESTKEIVIHSIDKKTMNFQFFVKDELMEFISFVKQFK